MSEIDDDDKQLFRQFLEELGPEWLEKIKAAKPEPKQEPVAAPADLASFLGEQVRELKKLIEKKSDLLDEVMDLLTPEQRIQLRKLRSGEKLEDPGPTKSEPAERSGAKPRLLFKKL